MLHHLIEILDIPLLSSSRENENKFMMCTRILSFSNIGCFFTTSKKKKGVATGEGVSFAKISIDQQTFYIYSPFGVVLKVGNFFKIERKSLTVEARFPVDDQVTSLRK